MATNKDVTEWERTGPQPIGPSTWPWPGNGAREKLREYLDKIIDGPLKGELKVDHLLAWLYTQGYVIVPIKDMNDGW